MEGLFHLKLWIVAEMLHDICDKIHFQADVWPSVAVAGLVTWHHKDVSSTVCDTFVGSFSHTTYARRYILSWLVCRQASSTWRHRRRITPGIDHNRWALAKDGIRRNLAQEHSLPILTILKKVAGVGRRSEWKDNIVKTNPRGWGAFGSAEV